MSTEVIIGVVAVSLAVLLVAWALVADPDRLHREAVANLSRNLDANPPVTATPGQVIARPRGLLAFARSLTPSSSARRLDRWLARAGRPPAWPLDRLLAAKIVLGAVMAALSLLFVTSSGTVLALLAGVCFTVLAYFVPDLLILSRGQERSQAIQVGLADALDQMVIAVEAGLGFEAAMAHVARNGRGPLAQELVRTLQDIQVGQPRRQAYQALADRNEVPDLSRFIAAIIQADIYGIAIGDVLRTQATEMRLKRRQRAEEKAMQVPVKVVFPLVLCILPVLFIVVMGPAVQDIMGIFNN